MWTLQGKHSGQQTLSAPKLLPFRSTCSGARLSRNMRISPHMPPWRPGAPRMTASASRMSCSTTAAVSPLCEHSGVSLCIAATLAVWTVLLLDAVTGIGAAFTLAGALPEGQTKKSEQQSCH